MEAEPYWFAVERDAAGRAICVTGPVQVEDEATARGWLCRRGEELHGPYAEREAAWAASVEYP